MLYLREVFLTKPAILALADGSIFRGEAIGADGQTVGEVVFNTAMTGYQEILTDPSYAQQIVTLTYPHIGNTGTTPEDAESNRVWSAGLVIRDLPLVAATGVTPVAVRLPESQQRRRHRRYRHPPPDPHPA
jgi:carbamoyl-phosphate synthase small subunit